MYLEKNRETNSEKSVHGKQIVKQIVEEVHREKHSEKSVCEFHLCHWCELRGWHVLLFTSWVAGMPLDACYHAKASRIPVRPFLLFVCAVLLPWHFPYSHKSLFFLLFVSRCSSSHTFFLQFFSLFISRYTSSHIFLQFFYKLIILWFPEVG